MKKTLLIGLIFLSSLFIHAQHIDSQTASKAAQNWISHQDGFNLLEVHTLSNPQGDILGYHYDLSPTGYMVLSANKSLPPIIAYSLTSVFSMEDEYHNPLQDMLVRDLEIRMTYLMLITEDVKTQNQLQWTALFEGWFGDRAFEQWPPPGYTSTGGWLDTNWQQSQPYNKFCPWDNVNNARSIAGCPAVALAMIINYQKTLHGTQFNDNEDDYYHSYAGRQYWIYDDAAGWDFPNFVVLNEYFDSMEQKFSNASLLNENEMAALVFGCGVAAKQVFTSSVSGTFGVNQAYDAYMRFGYQEAILVYDSDTSFYTQMKNNIKESMIVHLAVLSNTGQGGHNVVADGYNTNDYYHLNFGWGGSYNGWYLLPDEIPYNLTIVEGAVLDIGGPQVGLNEELADNPFQITIFPNPGRGTVTIEMVCFDRSESQVEIRDARGLLIKEIASGILKPGSHLFKWQTNVPSGIYYVCILSDEARSVQKLIVSK